MTVLPVSGSTSVVLVLATESQQPLPPPLPSSPPNVEFSVSFAPVVGAFTVIQNAALLPGVNEPLLPSTQLMLVGADCVHEDTPPLSTNTGSSMLALVVAEPSTVMDPLWGRAG